MANEIILNVELRERTGTGGARETRRAGRIPGILYGGGKDPVPVSFDSIEILKALNSGKFLAHMVRIDNKGDRQSVIPQDIQLHPVTDQPLHIDLYRVDARTASNTTSGHARWYWLIDGLQSTREQCAHPVHPGCESTHAKLGTSIN